MDVLDEVYSFYGEYRGEKGVFGYSELKKPLPYMVVGSGRPVILYQYAMHAREYITAYLALEHIKGEAASGTSVFAPMINPDGVEIALKNPAYKANAKGVDLNVNFDARWGTGVKNKRAAGDSDYIGEYPFSAEETRALRNFTLLIKPDMTVSYHAKGEEIYWYFYQGGKAFARDKRLAEAAAKVTGYKIAYPAGSAGGYKDWCIETLGIPALTIEVGGDDLSHPIGKEHLREIYLKNKGVPAALSAALGG